MKTLIVNSALPLDRWTPQQGLSLFFFPPVCQANTVLKEFETVRYIFFHDEEDQFPAKLV